MLVILLVAATPGVARAEQDCEARLAFVSERLHADARAWRRHQWIWGVAFLVVAPTQTVLGFVRDDEGERVELWVGASKSVLALVPLFVKPVPAGGDVRGLDTKIAATRAGPARCELVAEADRLLLRSARNEESERGWLPHTLNVLVNGGGLLIVGLGYDRWLTGAIGAAVGASVGALRIYTRPTGSLRAQWTITPVVGQGTTGVTFTALF